MHIVPFFLCAKDSGIDMGQMLQVARKKCMVESCFTSKAVILNKDESTLLVLRGLFFRRGLTVPFVEGEGYCAWTSFVYWERPGCLSTARDRTFSVKVLLKRGIKTTHKKIWDFRPRFSWNLWFGPYLSILSWTGTCPAVHPCPVCPTADDRDRGRTCMIGTYQCECQVREVTYFEEV